MLGFVLKNYHALEVCSLITPFLHDSFIVFNILRDLEWNKNIFSLTTWNNKFIIEPTLIHYPLFISQLVVDDDDKKEWTMYDTGPRHIKCPLICLPPASGKAEVFFKQLLQLSTAGFRVIAVSFLLFR
jgi:hypothetical protein